MLLIYCPDVVCLWSSNLMPFLLYLNDTSNLHVKMEITLLLQHVQTWSAYSLVCLSYSNTAVPVAQDTPSYRHPWPPRLYISITKFHWVCLQDVYPVKCKSTSTHHLCNYHVCSNHYRLSQIFSYFPFYGSSFFFSRTHCLLHNVWVLFFF